MAEPTTQSAVDPATGVPQRQLISEVPCPAYRLKKLTAEHKRAIRMRLNGRKAREIAEELKVHIVTVHRWLNDPLAKAEMSALQAEVATQVVQNVANGGGPRTATQVAAEHAPQAVKLFKTMMDEAEDPELRVKCAKEILRLAGCYASETGSRLTVNIGADAVKALMDGKREAESVMGILPVGTNRILPGN